MREQRGGARPEWQLWPQSCECRSFRPAWMRSRARATPPPASLSGGERMHRTAAQGQSLIERCHTKTNKTRTPRPSHVAPAPALLAGRPPLRQGVRLIAVVVLAANDHAGPGHAALHSGQGPQPLGVDERPVNLALVRQLLQVRRKREAATRGEALQRHVVGGANLASGRVPKREAAVDLHLLPPLALEEAALPLQPVLVRLTQRRAPRDPAPVDVLGRLCCDGEQLVAGPVGECDNVLHRRRLVALEHPLEQRGRQLHVVVVLPDGRVVLEHVHEGGLLHVLQLLVDGQLRDAHVADAVEGVVPEHLEELLVGRAAVEQPRVVEVHHEALVQQPHVQGEQAVLCDEGALEVQCFKP
mmetsp:Transcript_19591/g.75146  ORF Transcript_19591/g.75146 Transcript_19591/m.75146 type:complete len:357 (-) Transcript_19591:494-1564(-)